DSWSSHQEKLVLLLVFFILKLKNFNNLYIKIHTRKVVLCNNFICENILLRKEKIPAIWLVFLLL
ncbi:hypothetical protein, partial [Clostridium sp. L74]|uniref:hypothetical protein n=1 Tax=Clostridium sp. L74 TaxID=1560217 RepID=UPI001A9A4D2D